MSYFKRRHFGLSKGADIKEGVKQCFLLETFQDVLFCIPGVKQNCSLMNEANVAVVQRIRFNVTAIPNSS